ncbi:hypothetical protein ACWIGI_07335 [Nocardia sp. NPDC055321]
MLGARNMAAIALACGAALIGPLGVPGIGTAAPIPSVPGGAPEFLGAPATPRPVDGVPPVPRHPGLAATGDSGIHNDGWMSDTYTRSGPLGHDTRVDSLLLGSECGSLAFDRAGRIVATCPGLNPGVYLIDPAGMRVLGRYPLPGREPGALLRPGAFTNFGGGAYFYLDDRDRAIVGAATGHVLVLAQNATADGFVLEHDYDLTGVLRPGEQLNSVLPDSAGRLWFVAKSNGVVGTIDPETGAIQVIRLGDGAEGQIQNSFAVGSDGDVYIATNREMLRLDAGPGGAPEVTWRVTYANSGQHKPGQIDDGTGTTPTILPGGYVAITDNADPMNVVVYRTARDAARREVCSVPVFETGAGNTENSLIGAGNSLIVENNYGYTGPEATLGGRTTTPGFARIDIAPDGSGCAKVWTNTTVAAPSVVPKLSLANGLIYTYTKGSEPTDPWYWTTLDFHTGNLVWQRHSGSGPLYNNNYAGLAIGPDGAAYLGTLGGLISLRDGN